MGSFSFVVIDSELIASNIKRPVRNFVLNWP
ncbi:hypothetical protein Cycma_4749 [Cyclobacterium marinum DSM 745]|uniref:Uncharacterized protein n=1 Tax=Cyclobacterium marinum (strain ATCC 25205 / DSM 745 / LMG 13164 / NCIMB 1802) TaxID=880070 RepID=G0J5I5_CYCMS|nr:hypothetical protein Cycma_4749 [Cyclobacterium marinum DSM 745]